MDPDLVRIFQIGRRNEVLRMNALDVDYYSEWTRRGLPNTIDYLQVDIDPPEQSLKALKKPI